MKSPRLWLPLLLSVLSAALCTATNGAAQPPSPDPAAVATFLEAPRSTIFGVVRKGGVWSLLDRESHFNAAADGIDKLTFDFSNGPILANLGAGGALRTLTTFRGDYRAMTTGWPGVWMGKDAAATGSYAFTMDWNGRTIELAARLPGDPADPKKPGGKRVDWDLATGLIDNVLPVTTLFEPQGKFTATLVLCAPVSPDGRLRPAAAIYGLLLKNTGSEPLEASVMLPVNNGTKNANTSGNWASKDPFDFEVGPADAPLADSATGPNGDGFDATRGEETTRPVARVSVKLAPGACQWIPAALFQPGEIAPRQLAARNSLDWLKDSTAYARSLLGRLTTPDHPWLADFHERELLQALHSLAMKPAEDGTGTFIGSSWGSYEATRLTWMKDCFYSALPFATTYPELARQEILWFSRYGVRPQGTRIRGGVNHSISLSVASLILAGLYHQGTADSAFFLGTPELRARWDEVLTTLLASRSESDPWLFPSDYISDGPCGPGYHTGSNLAVWFAVKSYARLLDEVYGDKVAAEKMRSLAERIHAAILQHCVIKGADIAYLNETAPRPGAEPRPFHDGEESETTLATFYGFLATNDPLYGQTMRFATSPANPNYNPEFFGLKWKSVPITAPGYNKALGTSGDAANLFADHGGFTEMRRATDGDGSLWWWPYGYRGNPVYGQPIRAFAGIGKAGWAAGVFSTLFDSRFLGVDYDAPARRFRWSPSPAVGSFQWTDFPIGNDRFSLSLEPGAATFTNTTSHPAELVAELPAGKTGQVSINGVDVPHVESTQTVWGPAVRFSHALGPGEKIRILLR